MMVEILGLYLAHRGHVTRLFCNFDLLIGLITQHCTNQIHLHRWGSQRIFRHV